MLSIVLSRRDWREFDQIITLYTRAFGKREALARGVKKITSKNSPFLEPGNLIEVETVGGGEWELITTVEPAAVFKAIRLDLAKAATAAALLHAMEILTHTGEPDAAVFNLLQESLTELDKIPRTTPLFLATFLWRLAALLGFGPEFNRCVLCGKSENFSVFDFSAGGLICAVCAALNPAAPHRLAIAKESQAWLAGVFTSSWQSLTRAQLSSPKANQLLTLAEDFLRFHTGVNIPLKLSRRTNFYGV